MSDTGKEDTGIPAGVVASTFTEREMQMLAWAMQSLKSGPPEIDYEKLANFAGMGNPRSASNAWAKIRNKLNTGNCVPLTPKKGGAKKKGTVGDGNGEADDANGEAPKKTPRKRAPKKQDVDGEASPKKKRTPAKGKKGSEEPANIDTESANDSQDLETDSKIKIENADDPELDEV